ncbi:hypothetical protein PC9H_004018 [Pleurotus ostreatus]|uniref:Uncharacterized protein n=1 Tax=Pleurotus ostreatus TaxID=5322 RepID=A0A8H7DVU4_PLEOS|nr:uncharacterized protein PC9H_004018 [Pleurotus ostreatus]KAF7437182.1 hypothetical protein PC9H_004018 [Pleurotus ostreatus]
MSNGNYPGPNLIPWFVSDVTPPDFSVTISSLLDPSFFPPPATADETVDPSLPSDLFRMVSRWRKYVDDGMKLSILLDTSLGIWRIYCSTDLNDVPVNAYRNVYPVGPQTEA